jgi:sulfatase maturation enzyme AslB (radical SAM superfamily)
MIPAWALQKAIKMFGLKATVSKDRCHFYKAKPPRMPMCSGIGSHPQPCLGKIYVYQVGQIVLGMFNEIKGTGMTWQEAFKRADLSKHRNECRRCLYRQVCRKARLIGEAADAMRDRQCEKIGIQTEVRS